jgi:peroxiredoxin Q/BCP
MLVIGQKAPEFCIPNQDEIEVCLRDMVGYWVVLYFYPKDNTTSCSIQACDFTNRYKLFEDLNATIYGININNPKEHRDFIKKKSLNITLLSDETKQVCKDYKVWSLKKIFGKEYMGINRITYIIDPNGNIAAIWDKVKVRRAKTIDGKKIEILHVDEVKNKLQELQNG